MRDRIIITITDLDGSKHFNVHQVIKKIILAIILFTLLIFVIGAIIIKVLINNVNALEDKKNMLSYLNISHEQRIKELNSLIGQKSQELKTFSDSLENIEIMIGLKEDKDLSLKERVDLAKISSIQKHYMLSNIPNGSPIVKPKITDVFGWRIHPIKKKRSFTRGLI